MAQVQICWQGGGLGYQLSWLTLVKLDLPVSQGLCPLESHVNCGVVPTCVSVVSQFFVVPPGGVPQGPWCHAVGWCPPGRVASHSLVVPPGGVSQGPGSLRVVLHSFVVPPGGVPQGPGSLRVVFHSGPIHLCIPSVALIWVHKAKGLGGPLQGVPHLLQFAGCDLGRCPVVEEVPHIPISPWDCRAQNVPSP